MPTAPKHRRSIPPALAELNQLMAHYEEFAIGEDGIYADHESYTAVLNAACDKFRLPHIDPANFTAMVPDHLSIIHAALKRDNNSSDLLKMVSKLRNAREEAKLPKSSSTAELPAKPYNRQDIIDFVGHEIVRQELNADDEYCRDMLRRNARGDKEFKDYIEAVIHRFEATDAIDFAAKFNAHLKKQAPEETETLRPEMVRLFRRGDHRGMGAHTGSQCRRLGAHRFQEGDRCRE